MCVSFIGPPSFIDPHVTVLLTITHPCVCVLLFACVFIFREGFATLCVCVCLFRESILATLSYSGVLLPIRFRAKKWVI